MLGGDEFNPLTTVESDGANSTGLALFLHGVLCGTEEAIQEAEASEDAGDAEAQPRIHARNR